MKKTLLTLGIVLVFAFGANAGVPSPFSFYAGGAVSLPSSDFGTSYKTGWHGMAAGGYKIAPKFQLIGKIEMHNFSSDLSALSLDGGDTKFTMFGADARYSLGLPAAPIAPFVFGGFGMAHITISEFSSSTLSTAVLDLINTDLPASANKMYWNIGTGFEIKSGPAWSFFVQGRYVNVSAEGGDSFAFIPVTIGVKFF